MRIQKIFLLLLTSLPYFIGFSQNDSIQEIEKGIWLEPVAPKFPGGGKRMKSFIQLVKHFPDSAKAKEIEGKVYVQFLVGKTGELSNFNILRSPDSSLSQEAIRIMMSLRLFSGKLARIIADLSESK